VPGEIGEAPGPASGVEVGARGEEPGLGVAELSREQGRVGERAGADGQVESLLHQVHVARRQERLDADARVGAEERGRHRSEVTGEVDRGCDAHEPTRLRAERRYRALRLLEARIQFLKNIGIGGGLLAVLGAGPGRFSVDARRSREAALGGSAEENAQPRTAVR